MLHGYEWRFFAGMGWTLAVAVLSLGLAVTLGLAGAAAKLSARRAWRLLATTYTTVVRGTPELILIVFIYYDLQYLLNAILETMGVEVWIISPFFAGVLGIGVVYGAYMTETFRGAILAVPKGQAEAGVALGLARGKIFFRLILPQMMRHALPGIRNNWLVLLKATALVSVIGFADDMMAVANQAKTKTREPFLFYFAVACGYLLFTALSDFFYRKLERRAMRGVAR